MHIMQDIIAHFKHSVYLSYICWLLFQKILGKHIPSFLMNRMEHYTNKRLSELQSQIMRKRWQTIELEKAVEKFTIGSRIN